MNNPDLATALATLITELDSLVQTAADKANVDKEGENIPPVMRSYYLGAMFGYEDTRDKIAALLAKHLTDSLTGL